MPPFQRDAFFHNRHGFAQFYRLSCGSCGATLCLYQKDGPGPLKRLYLDRMSEIDPAFAPDQKLHCRACGKPLGLGLLYEKENRPAFILFQDAVKKKPDNLLRALWCSLRSLIPSS